MSRTHFNSSALVRLLAQATGCGAGAGLATSAVAPRQDVAERLSQWLNAFDAIALHGVHQSAAAAAPAAAKTTAQTAGRQAQLFAEAFEQTRATLVALITVQERKPVPGPGPGGVRRRAQGTTAAAAATNTATNTAANTATNTATNTAAAAPPETDTAPDYGRYFKRHLELQRQMAQKIGPLRAQARQVLVRSAPRLRPLAELDALMEQTISGREHKLLAHVPALLEKRFEQLLNTPGAGPAAFDREWEAIVRAELYLRLQPVVGMMEAWGASPPTTQ